MSQKNQGGVFKIGIFLIVNKHNFKFSLIIRLQFYRLDCWRHHRGYCSNYIHNRGCCCCLLSTT